MAIALPLEPCVPVMRETTNLSLAAFAFMRKVRIVRATERRGHGNVEYQFAFDDPDGRWDALMLEFANSECCEFDNCVRTLKNLCKRNGRT